MYDAYAPMAERAGATVVTVGLNVEDWSIPREALAAAFSDRTKLLLINSPHNPTGKVRFQLSCSVQLDQAANSITSTLA